MKRGNTKVKNEKYWSKLVIGAICMMAVATVPTRVNAETLPEEKDTIESEMADLQEDIVLESNEVAEDKMICKRRRNRRIRRLQ